MIQFMQINGFLLVVIFKISYISNLWNETIFLERIVQNPHVICNSDDAKADLTFRRSLGLERAHNNITK